jgi:predicted HicB family RNase H-like nuclease
MRKKINVSIDEQLIAKLQEEAVKKNLSLSRLIENKLKGIA